jgi:5-methyltetrahydropteroyltriglutamate--homocysteine methyltransferase
MLWKEALMRRSDDRILTTHVGSLIRPPELLELAAAARDKPDQQQKFFDAVRAATHDVVKRQISAGVDSPNDGEYGKSSWANYVLERMTGFEHRPDKMAEPVWLGSDRIRFREFMKKEFPRGVTGAPVDACIGSIQYVGHDAVRRNIRDLKAALATVKVQEGFLTAVAPASTGYDAENEYYENERDYVFAIAEALREEYLEIYNSGLVLQVDDAVLANMYDHLMQQSPARYRAWAELRVEARIHALRGLPDKRMRSHIGDGSWRVPQVSDAPLEAVVGLVLRV